MTTTSFTTMRLAVARLRRTPYGMFSRAYAVGGKPIPVPFIADDGRDEDQLDHGLIKRSIFTDEGTLLCQVCGEAITDEDTTFFLLVDNDPGYRPSEEWTDLTEYKPHYLDVDDPSMAKVRSNSGPVHVYCARVSLRLCPAIKNDEPTKIIGWTSAIPAPRIMSPDTTPADYWIENRSRVYTILAQVPRTDLVTMTQLDEMIDAVKQTNP